MAFAIFFTGDLLRECAFSSRTSAFDQVRRLVGLARLLAIGHSCERHAAAAALSLAEPAWDEKTVTKSNELVADIHDRMAVVLRRAITPKAPNHFRFESASPQQADMVQRGR
jgi:hypothetical protein